MLDQGGSVQQNETATRCNADGGQAEPLAFLWLGKALDQSWRPA